MLKEDFKKMLYYKTAVSLIREMARKGIISAEDFKQAEDAAAEKYQIAAGSIYRATE